MYVVCPLDPYEISILFRLLLLLLLLLFL